MLGKIRLHVIFNLWTGRGCRSRLSYSVGPSSRQQVRPVLEGLSTLWADLILNLHVHSLHVHHHLNLRFGWVLALVAIVSLGSCRRSQSSQWSEWSHSLSIRVAISKQTCFSIFMCTIFMCLNISTSPAPLARTFATRTFATRTRPPLSASTASINRSLEHVPQYSARNHRLLWPSLEILS